MMESMGKRSPLFDNKGKFSITPDELEALDKPQALAEQIVRMDQATENLEAAKFKEEQERDKQKKITLLDSLLWRLRLERLISSLLIFHSQIVNH